MAKKKVKLQNDEGSSIDLDFDHAERLLKLVESKKSNTWKLNDKNYQFENGKLTAKSNTRDSKKAE